MMWKASGKIPSPDMVIAAMLGRFREAIHRVLDNARRRRALACELSELSMTGDFDRVMGDIGLSRSDVAAMVKGCPDAPQLLAAMAARVGVELSAIKDATVLRELQRSCTFCGASAQCRRWLRSGRAAGYRSFCPNAALFDEVRENATRKEPARVGRSMGASPVDRPRP